MEIKISAIHFDASSHLEEFINKKVSKLNQYSDSILKADVTLKVVKPESANNKEVHIRLAVPGNDLYAEKVADTFEEAVDLSAEALEKQLKKMKDKLDNK
jgi:putative sigma-54 modulation protein